MPIWDSNILKGKQWQIPACDSDIIGKNKQRLFNGFWKENRVQRWTSCSDYLLNDKNYLGADRWR